MKKIAVFYGGESIEHDISVITGVLTLNSLDAQKFTPIPIYVDKSGKFFTGSILFSPDEYKNLDYKRLTEVTLISGDNGLYTIKHNKKHKEKGKIKRLCSISCAINCIHGERGEDGCVSALTKLCNIPLASPDIYCSAVCMDKWLTKAVLKGLGVKTLKGIVVDSANDIDLSKVTFPVIVKPNCAGSSIGITKAENSEELTFAVRNALKFGERALIEPFVQQFTEINCAVYKDFFGKIKASECEKPKTDKEILTFSDKYQGGEREFPANISEQLRMQIQDISKKVYKKLNANGIIRIDFMVIDNQPFVNEINTTPGSMAYYLFCSSTKEFKDILTNILGGVMRANAKRQTEIRRIDTGLLSGFIGKGAKKVEIKE